MKRLLLLSLLLAGCIGGCVRWGQGELLTADQAVRTVNAVEVWKDADWIEKVVEDPRVPEDVRAKVEVGTEDIKARSADEAQRGVVGQAYFGRPPEDKERMNPGVKADADHMKLAGHADAKTERRDWREKLPEKVVAATAKIVVGVGKGVWGVLPGWIRVPILIAVGLAVGALVMYALAFFLPGPRRALKTVIGFLQRKKMEGAVSSEELRRDLAPLRRYYRRERDKGRLDEQPKGRLDGQND